MFISEIINMGKLISKWRMNTPNEPFITFLAPVCLQPFARVEYKAYRRTRWHRHLWKSDLTPIPTDGVIKAYKLPPGPKTHASKELGPGLGALWARCKRPREGLDPSQKAPENTHITEGALTGHRHLQGFKNSEWKSEEKEKSEMV